MLLTPKLNKSAQLLKLSEKHLKQIIDLLLKGLSINDIADHLDYVENRPDTYRFVKKLAKFVGKRAKRLNKYYDSLVREKIKVLEVDEIYQGRHSMFLGVVHKQSTYLLGLEQSQGKDIDTMTKKLKPYFDPCINLQIVITDGLPSYHEAIKRASFDIDHLICHVHGYREALRELDPILRKSHRSFLSLKKRKEHIASYKKSMRKSIRALNYHGNKLSELEMQRDQYLKEHGIAKYSKTKRCMKERKVFREKINVSRTFTKDYRISTAKWQKRIENELQKFKKRYKKYRIAKIDALQSARLVKEFKRLLDCKYNEYKPLFRILNAKLDTSPYSIVKYLKKVLKNNRKLFADKSKDIQDLVKPNRANTNTIESTFGRYRLFFNHLRNIKQTQYSNALFELLRLKHNLSGPYTGPNKKISPIKRLNINTQYTNFLECLFSQRKLMDKVN